MDGGPTVMLVDRLVIGAIVSIGMGDCKLGWFSLTGLVCCFVVRVARIDLGSAILPFSAFSSCIVLWSLQCPDLSQPPSKPPLSQAALFRWCNHHNQHLSLQQLSLLSRSMDLKDFFYF